MATLTKWQEVIFQHRLINPKNKSGIYIMNPANQVVPGVGVADPLQQAQPTDNGATHSYSRSAGSSYSSHIGLSLYKTGVVCLFLLPLIASSRAVNPFGSFGWGPSGEAVPTSRPIDSQGNQFSDCVTEALSAAVNLCAGRN